ncbi:MAG: nucleotide exchange factor GrpE [Ruminococcaceae bacterium]|nr:nucleotide exchange factor GrpE [Oscillospiraceae bacterium]
MYKKRKSEETPPAELTGNGNDSEMANSSKTEVVNTVEEAATSTETAAGEQLPEDISTLTERLAKTETDLKTLSDRYLRLMAEYDNYRKRSQKEREALYLDSVATVVKEWLPVIDNLARAEKSALEVEGEGATSIAEGITMVLRQANDAMERLNVHEIACLGQPFDPQMADAVMHVEDDSVGPSTVVEILQKGYACGDRVIRHCVVKVAN